MNALLTLGGLQLLTMLVLLVRTKTLALLLGPDGVGALAIVDKLLATVAQTISISLPFAAIRFLPELWSHSQDEFSALARNMRNLLMLLALLATVFALVVTEFWPEIWGNELLPYRTIIFFGFLSLPVVMFVPFVQNAIAGRLAHNASALFTLSHAAISALAGIAGVAIGGLSALYALYAISGVLVVVIGFRFVQRTDVQAPRLFERRFILRLPWRMWKFSFALSGLAFITPFAGLYVNYHLLSTFSIEVTGWMQAAVGVGLAIRNLLGSAHPLFLTPNVNRGGTPQERMEWANEFQKTFALLCAVMVIPLLLFPHIVVTLVYSAQFSPAGSFVGVFVIGEVLVLLAGTYQALVLAFDHLFFHVAQNMLAQAVLLLVSIALIEPYGPLGAGLGGVSAQVLLYFGSTLFLYRKYAFRIPPSTVRLTLLLIVVLAIACYVGVHYPQWSIEVVSSKIFLYGVLLMVVGRFLTPNDRAKLVQLVRGVRMGLQVLRT